MPDLRKAVCSSVSLTEWVNILYGPIKQIGLQSFNLLTDVRKQITATFLNPPRLISFGTPPAEGNSTVTFAYIFAWPVN